jgi:hypothetical protein
MQMSSISPLSSVTSWATDNQQKDPRAVFRQLMKDINNGNLSAAQQDYATITSNQNGPATHSPLGSDFAALGDALNAGDIQSAQRALATMQSDAKKLHGHGHHHHHAPEPPPIDPSAPNADATVGTTLNVTA